MLFGLLVFWMSMIGISFLLYYKLHLERMFCLTISFVLTSLFVYFTALLNMMKLGAVSIAIFGVGSFLYYMYRLRGSLKSLFFDIQILFLILFFSIITLYCNGLFITHIDDYGHWALIIKIMFMKDVLPNFEFEQIVGYKNYQPGSAMFIYYLGYISGKSEMSMIIAQRYLEFSFLIPLIKFSEKNKNSIIYIILIFVLYILSLTFPFKINAIAVDRLLGLMMVGCITISYYYKDDIHLSYLFSMPILIFFILVKNTGIVLFAISILFILTIHIRKKYILNIKYLFLVIIMSFLALYSWNQHVKYAYGHYATNVAHSISKSRVKKLIQDKGGISGVSKFYIRFLKHSFCYKTDSFKFIIICNILLLIAAILYWNYIKKIFLCIFAINISYTLYTIALGAMYVLAMSKAEADRYAGFVRYQSTILIAIFGIIFLFLLILSNYSKKNYRTILLLLLMFISTFFLQFNSIKYNFNRNPVYGYGLEADTFEIEKIIDKIPNKYKNYYIYYDPTLRNDASFRLRYMKYKTLKRFYKFQQDKMPGYKNSVLVVWNSGPVIEKMLIDYKWKKIYNHIWVKD